MWRHFECREILNVDLFCCHLRCFVAKPVLSRLTHFLCGDKLSQIVCPWRKITNTMYEEEHCFISLLALYELFYSFSLLSAHMVNQLNPQSKCSTHINIYLHICAWTLSLWKIFVTYSFAKSKLQRSSNFLYQALAKSLLKVIRSNIFFSAWFFGAMFIMKHWHIKQYLNIQRAARNLHVTVGCETFCQQILRLWMRRDRKSVRSHSSAFLALLQS